MANSENLKPHRKPLPTARRPCCGWSTAAVFTPSKSRNHSRVAPEQVHWFRWEAAMTWLSGMVLMFLLYYFSGGLIDPDVADISQGRGIAIGLGVAGFGLDRLRSGGAVVSGQIRDRVCDIFAGHDRLRSRGDLSHVFSGRAAYIHVGAMFGTIMMLNVWERILPAQRKMIAAAAAGATFDASLGAQAKLRSKHNTFMAVPVVFIMLSNHFPVATYGNRYSWQILVALVVVGWAAAEVIRRA